MRLSCLESDTENMSTAYRDIMCTDSESSRKWKMNLKSKRNKICCFGWRHLATQSRGCQFSWRVDAEVTWHWIICPRTSHWVTCVAEIQALTDQISSVDTNIKFPLGVIRNNRFIGLYNILRNCKTGCVKWSEPQLLTHIYVSQKYKWKLKVGQPQNQKYIFFPEP